MQTLWEALKEEYEWTGSLDKLVLHSNALTASLPVGQSTYLPPRTRSTAMDYRSQRIISPAKGKSFTWLHLVQFCAARYLVELGWKREEVAAWIRGQDGENLLETIERTARPSTGRAGKSQNQAIGMVRDRYQQASLVVRLLAAGIVGQYQSVRRGIPVVQDNSLDPMLSRAMMGLASLYLLEGREDVAGSVHDLLKRCAMPLHDVTWGLDVFGSAEFPYHALRLIDPDARLPTLDCIELASQTRSELDLREQLAFEALRSASDQFATRTAEVYSLLRAYVVEHPITSLDELQTFERENDLQPAHAFLLSCYEPVLPHHLAFDQLYACSRCGTPMVHARLAKHVACRIPQCEAFDRPVAVTPIKRPHDLVRIAKAHILSYWVAPGIDELAIFRKAQASGLHPVIYPDRDACDIALDGGNTGIDVKSNASPFLLAETLTRSLHGLEYYDVRIVAINDQCAARVPGYLDLLRREYRGKSKVEFMSVSALLNRLEEPR